VALFLSINSALKKIVQGNTNHVHLIDEESGYICFLIDNTIKRSHNTISIKMIVYI